MAFIEKGQTYNYDQILSGTGHKTMELKVPQGKKVSRGDAVSYDCELSDGSNLFGIVLEDADGTTAETKTTVVVSGEVVFDKLKVKEGTQFEDFVKKARQVGIIAKELGGKQ